MTSEDAPIAELMTLWAAICAFQESINKSEPGRLGTPAEDVEYDRLLDNIERIIAGLHNKARALQP